MTSIPITRLVAAMRTLAMRNLAIVVALGITACGGQSDTSVLTPPDTTTTEFVVPKDRTPLIVGGVEVTDNSYPWMAAISYLSEPSAAEGQFCGGSLIAPEWILTAAHCFANDRRRQIVHAREVNVLLGQRNLAYAGGETINVSRIIQHPDYQTSGYPDLALVKLVRPSAAKTILLPTRENPIGAFGETMTVLGWGQVSENGPATNELMQASLSVVGHNWCNRAYGGAIIKDAMLCAGTNDGSMDSCYGDSGGPLFVQRGQSTVQAGVVSFGDSCGSPDVPGGYARVSSYHDWIAAYANVTFYQGESTGLQTENTATETGSPLSTVCIDSNGDGWGWDGVRSCLVNVAPDGSVDVPPVAACIDTDGDGWGWDGVRSCLVDEPTDDPVDTLCVDTDGDGWGWDGSKSCLISNNSGQ